MDEGRGDSPLGRWGDDLRHVVVIEASRHECRTELWRFQGLRFRGACMQVKNNGMIRQQWGLSPYWDTPRVQS